TAIFSSELCPLRVSAIAIRLAEAASRSPIFCFSAGQQRPISGDIARLAINEFGASAMDLAGPRPRPRPFHGRTGIPWRAARVARQVHYRASPSQSRVDEFRCASELKGPRARWKVY